MIEAETLQPWRRRRDTLRVGTPRALYQPRSLASLRPPLVRPMIEIAAPRLRVRRDDNSFAETCEFLRLGAIFSLQPANIFPC